MARLNFDPELLPVDSLGGEPVIASDRLSATFLRQHFAQPPIWTPEITVERLVREMSGPPIDAAVLIPIVLRESGPTLLLTQRTAHLRDHAGQISFPGGRVDDTDASPLAAALRETEEEIGLDRQFVEIIGQLPEYQTGTGFRIQPFVGLVQPPFETVAEVFEVAEIFEVPLSFLMDGRHHQRRTAKFETGSRTFYVMPYGHYFIWGATAGMLRNLFHFLSA